MHKHVSFKQNMHKHIAHKPVKMKYICVLYILIISKSYSIKSPHFSQDCCNDSFAYFLNDLMGLPYELTHTTKNLSKYLSNICTN